GFLILSSSESIGTFSDLFSLRDKKQKIYSKKPTPAPLHYDFPTSRYPRERRFVDEERDDLSHNVDSLSEMRREAERLLIGNYTPSGVIVNSDLEVVHTFGDTGPYLTLRPGAPSLSLLKMAREGLSMDLRSVIHRARKEGKPAKKDGVRVKYNGSHKDLSI